MVKEDNDEVPPLPSHGAGLALVNVELDNSGPTLTLAEYYSVLKQLLREQPAALLVKSFMLSSYLLMLSP